MNNLEDLSYSFYMENARIQTKVSVGNGASLEVNKKAMFYFVSPSSPKRITFWIRGPLTGNSPTLSFRNSAQQA